MAHTCHWIGNQPVITEIIPEVQDRVRPRVIDGESSVSDLLVGVGGKGEISPGWVLCINALRIKIEALQTSTGIFPVFVHVALRTDRNVIPFPVVSALPAVLSHKIAD